MLTFQSKKTHEITETAKNTIYAAFFNFVTSSQKFYQKFITKLFMPKINV